MMVVYKAPNIHQDINLTPKPVKLTVEVEGRSTNNPIINPKIKKIIGKILKIGKILTLLT
jgi:hypothetical protein